MRFLLSLLALSAFAGPLSESDRGVVLNQLEASRKMFLDSIADVSPAQWTYKAGPDRWSIAEVSEHIVAADGFIGGLVRETIMKSPADTAKAAHRQPFETRIDAGLLAAIRDRSQKATAPAQITPKGIYKTPGEAAEAFKIARSKTMDYVRGTQDDLRDHFSDQLTGTELDGVQGLLMLSGHTERHVAQIEEVKASPGYPKT
jgi:hypothetical protein